MLSSTREMSVFSPSVMLCLSLLSFAPGLGCDRVPPLPELPDAGGDVGPDGGGGPAEFYRGTWGALTVATVISTNAPEFFEAWAEARTWHLLTMIPDGKNKVTVTSKVCMVRFKSPIENASLQMTTPTTKQVPIPMTSFDVDVYSHVEGSRFFSTLIYITYGLNLCDNATSTLPESADAGVIPLSCDGPCTDSHCDQDNDGHPGITYTPKWEGGLPPYECDVYVSVRNRCRLDGEVINEDEIAGAIIDGEMKQIVHGATDPLCIASNLNSEYDKCPSRHYFKALRLKDDAGCDDVIALTDCADTDNERTCDADEKKELDPRYPTEDDACDDN